jgi:membrane associated rhomboid family serine protease
MPALWLGAAPQLPATSGLLLLMATVAFAKFRRPAALDHWNKVAGGSLQEVRDGYWWSIVTPVLCHSDLGHFLYNSLFFYAYALPLERELGPAPLVALFFGSHVAAVLLKLLVNRIRHPEEYPFIGGMGCSRWPACACKTLASTPPHPP